MRFLIILFCSVSLTACLSTKKLRQAIHKKPEEKEVVVLPTAADTLKMIHTLLDSVSVKQRVYATFSARIKVDYTDDKGKQPDFVANVRIKKDSLVWMSIGNEIGIEGLRVLIDKDSIRILDKLANTIQIRPLSSIQQISQLPLALTDIQQLLVGNPVFFNQDSLHLISSGKTGHSLLSQGDFFRHLLYIGAEYQIEKSKLDDPKLASERSATLTYQDYEWKEGHWFATLRDVLITTKSTLAIRLRFKDYRFNEALTYPFTIPKKFKKIQ
jgi:hypothetical protein